MAQVFRRRQQSPVRWLRRLDRAATRMNPYLSLAAIGLLLVNLICLASLTAHLPIYHLHLDLACAAPAVTAPHPF